MLFFSFLFISCFHCRCVALSGSVSMALYYRHVCAIYFCFVSFSAGDGITKWSFMSALSSAVLSHLKAHNSWVTDNVISCGIFLSFVFILAECWMGNIQWNVITHFPMRTYEFVTIIFHRFFFSKFDKKREKNTQEWKQLQCNESTLMASLRLGVYWLDCSFIKKIPIVSFMSNIRSENPIQKNHSLFNAFNSVRSSLVFNWDRQSQRQDRHREPAEKPLNSSIESKLLTSNPQQ